MCLPIPQDGIQNHDKIYCFQFPLDTTVIPREIKDNIYARFWGVKKMQYGLCEKKLWWIDIFHSNFNVFTSL